MNAKEIIKNKFWIVEDHGERVGTLSLRDDQYMLSNSNGTRFFADEKQLERSFKANINWTDLEITETISNEVNNYPTSCTPYNSMFDIKRKLPLFTKSAKSKSLYCAGYYIIKFDKGWVKSFCPKQITVERYKTKGPFKSEIEMRTELSRVNK
jgi:hypothetical protein|tara:strand:- start:1815 stop:2273 length:459 start_codon:yes stop_codon:yes gene_type:complete